jgi:hypothetical protein
MMPDSLEVRWLEADELNEGRNSLVRHHSHERESAANGKQREFVTRGWYPHEQNMNQRIEKQDGAQKWLSAPKAQ